MPEMNEDKPFLGMTDPNRRALVVLVQLVVWTASFIGAFLLRFDFAIPAAFVRTILIALPVLLLLRVGSCAQFGLFRGLWRYTGTRDLVALAKASGLSSGAFVLFAVFALQGFPRSIFVIDWLAGFMAVGGMRLAIRLTREVSQSSRHSLPDVKQRKVLIVGAGDAGESLLREIQKSHSARYEVVGFVDDNPNKVGVHIHGVRVLGTVPKVPELVRDLEVEEVILAIPSATGRQMRRVVDICKPCEAQVRTIPGIDQLIDGIVFINQIRNVAIEDLLGREPVTLDSHAISEMICGRVLLVTGAGGSIGSEICRQLCKFNPAVLVLLEQAENALYEVHRELCERFPAVRAVPVICDIGDPKRLEHAFATHRPSIVFHAAAHKHVPMMEWNPGEAIKNNVFGTRNVADASDASGVERFVMISTDKAVHPPSILGASKRVAEIYVQSLAQRSETRFVTVRFGNVLGSNGSVIPLFLEQIARGGPLTVTHPEMKRYFMTIPEASQLVLQAATMGRGGEIFILDMGNPVKIVDLARDLVTLSGLRLDEDIEIRFTGMRPGEKLFEELSVAGENADKTRHPKIFVGRQPPSALVSFARHLGELRGLSDGSNETALRTKLREMVPEFASGGESERLAREPESGPKAEVIPLRRA
jgi:FlaA1/EpsC-like NDP-sugar epimerase